MRLLVLLYSASVAILLSAQFALGQDAAAPATSTMNCTENQIFNGGQCVCASGYFASVNDGSRSRCEDECEEVYYTWFTYGECISGIFDRVPADKQPACNLRCGMRIRLWAVIFILAVFAAAVATLFFTLPMCIATCCSCLQAKKANKNTKRVYVDQTVAATPQDKQLQSMGYNPYAYWPYYGRTA